MEVTAKVAKGWRPYWKSNRGSEDEDVAMIRKGLIVTLTLASLGTTVAAAVGFRRPIHEWMRIAPGTDLHVRWSDGLLRILLFRSDRPMTYRIQGSRIAVRSDQSTMTYSIQFVHPQVLRALSRRGNPVPALAWNRNFGDPALGPAAIMNSFVRMPNWVPPTLFLIYPLAVFIRSRLRARKAGPDECSGCGYNLTGNTTGRCPECGSNFFADRSPRGAIALNDVQLRKAADRRTGLNPNYEPSKL